MSDDKFQEKTEPATPKKREEARKKGQVAQSREITSVAILSTALTVFFFLGTWMFDYCSKIMIGIFSNLYEFQMIDDFAYRFFIEMMEKFLIVLAPLFLSLIIAAIGSNLLQVGFLFTVEPITPSLSKLDPIKGVKKLMSLSSGAELAKSIMKILIIGGMAYIVIKKEIENIPGLIHMAPIDILIFIGITATKLWLYSCLSFLVLAVLDFAFQKWRHEENLKMTKQEVKEEMKQREGDPRVKGQIRKTQMELSRNRMMEMVPDADVVITNPTRLAIAMVFDPKKMIAPKVVAKGAGHIAAKIREIARENDIPIMENKPLAQILFKSVDIGEFIPADLYNSVAEVLAYVYKMKGRLSLHS